MGYYISDKSYQISQNDCNEQILYTYLKVYLTNHKVMIIVSLIKLISTQNQSEQENVNEDTNRNDW